MRAPFGSKVSSGAPLNGQTANLSFFALRFRSEADEEIDLAAANLELVLLDQKIKEATERHNDFLKELGLPLLP